MDVRPNGHWGASFSSTYMPIRPSRQAEHPVLLALWERSVRATHTFLNEADIVFYRPLVAGILAGDALELWVLTDEVNVPIGMLGLAGHAIEALFLEPAHLRRGGGRRLVAHAQELRGGALTVDVNEQNAAARGFYEALGFEVVARSPLDETGRPYPILHMRRETPRREGAPDNNDPATCSVYTITPARPKDLAVLPAIELAAARLLAGRAPESVLNETTSDDVLTTAQRHGHLWVALADDVPVGFAHIAVIEPAVAHLEEVDVHPRHGRRGLGTKLVRAVCAWATAAGYHSVTLTTFRDVPWNMPFYARLGFEVIPSEALSPALRSVVQGETRRGLDPTRRVAMRQTAGVLSAYGAAEESDARRQK